MSNVLLSSWEKILRRQRHEIAVTECNTGQRATFQQLEDGAAAWLAAQNIELPDLRGHRVLFSAVNGIGWLEMFLGLLKAESVIIPLDAAEPIAAQLRIAEHVSARFWWNGTRLAAIGQRRRPRPRSELCLVKLTSGTTGAPRSLAFTAEQLLADADQVTQTMGITRRDLNYGLIPLGHSYGLGNLTLPLLAKGIPLACGTSLLPHAIAADFEKWKPTVFPGVPAMWRALSTADVKLSSLRLGISAGAALPAPVAREFYARHRIRLHNFYGSSESGGIAYDRSGAATLVGGVGRALRGVRLKIIPPDQLEISSAAVFTHLNRRCRNRSGCWRTSDIVKMDSRGQLTLLGRRGQTVKIAGRRVNLAEVAPRLRAVPGVTDAWAGLGRGNEAALGVIVATRLTVGDLRAALHSDTAPWKIPKKWVLVPALPHTARGKPDTRAMQEMIDH